MAEEELEETAPAEPAPVTHVANTFLDVPTVYADVCVFAAAIGPNMRLTFSESILGPSDSHFPGFHARHVGHLVMPREGFVNTLRYLNLIASQLGITLDDAAE